MSPRFILSRAGLELKIFSRACLELKIFSRAVCAITLGRAGPGGFLNRVGFFFQSRCSWIAKYRSRRSEIANIKSGRSGIVKFWVAPVFS